MVQVTRLPRSGLVQADIPRTNRRDYRRNSPKMPSSLFETLTTTMTENRCFPHSPDRGRIGLENRVPDCTKIRVGLTDCAETMGDRFSDRASRGLCVPEGQLVSSGLSGESMTFCGVQDLGRTVASSCLTIAALPNPTKGHALAISGHPPAAGAITLRAIPRRPIL